jgi:hypothetical protein
MEGSKLNEAKRRAVDLVGRMDPTDKVGLVQYDDSIDTVIPLTSVRPVRRYGSNACSGNYC